MATPLAAYQITPPALVFPQPASANAGTGEHQNSTLTPDEIIRTAFVDLVDERRWVAWRTEPTGKVPVNPATGGRAKTNKPATWSTYIAARRRAHRAGTTNVGLVSVHGFDLDDCRNAETGEATDWAIEIIETANTYTEISPSGTGFKLFFADGAVVEKQVIEVPPGKIEIFAGRAGYFTTTGRHVAGTPLARRPRPPEIEPILARFRAAAAERASVRAAELKARGIDDPTGPLAWEANIREGIELHDSLLRLAMSKAGSGLDEDEIIADLEAVMHESVAKGSKRWWARFRDIPRMVRGGFDRAESDEKRMDETMAGFDRFNNDPNHGAGYYANGGNAATTGETASTSTARDLHLERRLANNFATHYKGRVRHVTTWGKYLIWTGSRWRKDETVAAYSLIAKFIEKKAPKGCSSKTVAGVERMVKAHLACHPDDLDRDHWLLNTPGGTVDLKTGKLRPHDPADLITRITTATPRGDCLMWKAFLLKICANEEDVVAYLKKFLGYALVGETDEDTFAFGQGNGDNGKTTFLETFSGTLGDYHTHAASSLFMVHRHEPHPTGLADLNRDSPFAGSSRAMMRRFAAQGKPSDGPRGPGRAGEATDSRDLRLAPAVVGAFVRFSVDIDAPRLLGVVSFNGSHPHAGSGGGLGRRSSIRRRMFANSDRGTATSANWNTT